MEWLAPKDSRFRGPPRTAKEKNISCPGLTINFWQDQPFHRGWQPCKKTLEKSTVRAGFFGSHESWQLYHWNPWNPFVRLLRAGKKKTHIFQNVIFKIIKIQHQPQNHQNPALSSKSWKATFFVGCCGNPFKKARNFRGFKRGFGTTWYAKNILSGECHCYWEGVSALSKSVID